MLKVLITGFEPFGEYTENSSWAVAEKVAACVVEGVEIAVELLPISYSRVGDALHRAVNLHCPDLIVMLGQSGITDRIKLERVALNLMDSAKGDNDGYKPDEEPIFKGEENALFTSLPIKNLRKSIEMQGIPAIVSNSCGLYVCNRLYYEALRMCQNQTIEAIFVHLPLFNGQIQPLNSNKPSMSLDDMSMAIQTIISHINDTNRKI